MLLYTQSVSEYIHVLVIRIQNEREKYKHKLIQYTKHGVGVWEIAGEEIEVTIKRMRCGIKE